MKTNNTKNEKKKETETKRGENRVRRKFGKNMWIGFILLILLLTSSFLVTSVQHTLIKKQKNTPPTPLSFTVTESGEQQIPPSTNADPFQLIINNLTIVYNWTHLALTNLSITFVNGTDITQAGAEDNVTLLIYNNVGFSRVFTLIYDNDTYQGWGKLINVSFSSGYSPRRYFVDLLVSTEDYYYNGNVYSFKKYFKIKFGNHYFDMDAEGMLTVATSISVEPHDYNDYILILNSNIYAIIFNSSDYNVMTVLAQYQGFSAWWYFYRTEEFSLEDFAPGYYYAYMIVIYDEEVYFSPPSNTINTGEEEPTESSLSLLWFFGFLLIITLIRLLRARKKI